MVSPYVYLGGKLRLKATGRSAGDRVTVAISTNNGRTFAPIYSVAGDRPRVATVDLKDKIFRRYAYWLRVELTGGAGLDRFEVENDFQHAPRTLPWLGKGANTITVVGRLRPDDRHAVDRLPDHARPVVQQERDEHHDGRPCSTTSTSSTTPAGGRGARAS